MPEDSKASFTLNPLTILGFAQEKVPAVKYATGLVGVAAALSLIYAFLPGVSPTGIGVLILYALIAMLALFLVATAVRVAGPLVIAPAIALLWATCALIIAFMFFTVTAFAVGWPKTWALTILPTEIQKTSLVDAIGATSDASDTESQELASEEQPRAYEDAGRDSDQTSQIDLPEQEQASDVVPSLSPEADFEKREQNQGIKRLLGNWSIKFNRSNGPDPQPWFTFQTTINDDSGVVRGRLENDLVSGAFLVCRYQ